MAGVINSIMGYLDNCRDRCFASSQGIRDEGNKGIRMSKFVGVNVFAAVGAAIPGLLLFWAWIPPLEVTAASVVPDMVMAGGEYSVERELKWLRHDCKDVTTSAIQIDSRGFTHVLAMRYLGRPHLQPKNKSWWPVMANMPNGLTTHRIHLTFQCPPFYGLWPNVVVPPDLSFRVVGGTP